MAATSENPGGVGRLGRHSVARIGYGAMQLEARASGTPEERAEAIALLRYAVDHGVDHIDTADFYGAATVNTLLRDALAPYGDDLVIATKVGAVRENGSGALVASQRPAELRAQVESNLVNLGADHVGLVNLRRADRQPGILAEGAQVVDLDYQLAELIAMRDEGKLGEIGLSNVDADQVSRALAAGIACVQNMYSVLERSEESILDTCREHGIAWVPYFPLGSAFAQLASVADNAVVIDIAASLGATPAQVGLAWVLAHYDDALVIPGTTSRSHLDENLAAGDVQLDAASLEQLDALAAPVTTEE